MSASSAEASQQPGPLMRFSKTLLLTAGGAVLAYHLWHSLRALYYSLYWPVSISSDAALMRFHAWSLLQGQWPYRDIMTLNLPTTHYINALGLLVLGSSDLAFRWLDLVWVILLAGSCTLYLWRYDRMVAGLAGLLVLNLTLIATPLGAFQRESLMLLFWILALYAIDRALDSGNSKMQRAWLILAGMLASLTVFIKPTGALFCLAIFIYLSLFRKLSLPDRLVRGAFLLCGGILAVILIAIPLGMAGLELHLLGDYWTYFQGWSRLQETRPISDLMLHLFSLHPAHLSLPLSGGVNSPIDTGHLTLLSLGLIVYFIYESIRYRSVLPAGIWIILVVGLLHYLIQRKGFAYHVFPIWLSLEILLAWALVRLWKLFSLQANPANRSTREGAPGKTRMIASGLLVLGLIFVLAHRQSQARQIMSGYLNTNPPRLRLVPEVKKITQEYKLPNRFAQNLEVDSLAMPAFMHSNLQLATAYPMDHVLWGNSAYTQSSRQNFLTQLQNKKPALFVIRTGEQGNQRIWQTRLQSFPELKSILDNDYKLIKQIQEINRSDYAIYLHHTALSTDNTVQ